MDMAKTERTTSQDGTSISFERHGLNHAEGGALPLVLVEPPLRHRRFSAYAGLLPLLADQHAVVAYDRRGRGESGDAPSYHPSREVEDLAAVIEAVGGEAALYGYSSGALLALLAASELPGVRGLVVLEPPLHAEDDPRPDPLTIEVAQLAAVDQGAAVRRFHEAIGVPDEILGELAGSPDWPSMVETAATLAYDCAVADAVDGSVLGRVSAPTLVLDSAGSSDDLTGWATSVAALLPDARARSLPGEWHTVADDVLAPAIAEHLAEVARRLGR